MINLPHPSEIMFHLKNISAFLEGTNEDELAVRLQVLDEEWKIHTGHDNLDHYRGYWGSSTVQRSDQESDLFRHAESLLVQVEEDYERFHDACAGIEYFD